MVDFIFVGGPSAQLEVDDYFRWLRNNKRVQIGQRQKCCNEIELKYTHTHTHPHTHAQFWISVRVETGYKTIWHVDVEDCLVMDHKTTPKSQGIAGVNQWKGFVPCSIDSLSWSSFNHSKGHTAVGQAVQSLTSLLGRKCLIWASNHVFIDTL